MPTVFQAISTPVGGQVMSLENVKVQAKWPAKALANGKMMRNVTLSDSSGQIAVSLWGAAASLPIQDGQTITIQGPLKRGDYKGTPQLSGENGLAVVGGDPSQVAQAAPASHSDTAGVTAKDSTIIRQNSLTHATALVTSMGVGGDVFSAQSLVLQLAKVYAHYSETGETPESEEAPEPAPF
jgi:hypothetical protein